MKDSGIPWIGLFPERWSLQRYKRVFRERDERSKNGTETLLSVSAYTGVSPRSNLVVEGELEHRAASLEGYKICHPGDLVMNIMLAWNRAQGITKFDGIVSPAYSVFEVISDSDHRFLDYLVRCDTTCAYFKAWSYGIIESRLRLYPETFGSLFCALPTLDEQRIIADHLDRATFRIDTLVAKKTRFIELLREKRQALITHAVTKGLDPKVPMKDSGVEWLGSIPQNWSTKRLRFVCDVTTGSRDTINATEDGAYPFYVRSQEVARIDTYSADCEAVLTAGDGAGVGKVYHYANGKFDFHQRVYMMHNFRHVRGKFFFHYLSSLFAAVALDGGAKSTVDSLRMPVFKNFQITVPSLEEQDQILRFLEDGTDRIDTLIAKTERSIELLREHRTALITAAVTGKLDLRATA